MSSHETRQLGDVCTQDRVSVKAGERVDLRYIGLEGIEPETGLFIEGELSKTPDAPKANSFYFTSRHVLYGKLRPYLNKVATPEFEGKCSTEIIPLLPAESLNRDYLAYFLRSPQVVSRISRQTAGARMPRADMGVVLGLEIPVPTLNDQHSIVDILKRADGIRRLRKQAQETTRQLIPALFVDIFGDPATNPMGLPEIELGEVIVEGPQNGLYKPASAYGDGTRILRIDGFYDGAVTDWNSLRRLRLDDKKIAKYRLNPQDIIINRVNSPDYLGKSALVEGLQGDVVFESNMMRLSIDRDRVDPHYLICHLQLDSIKRQVLSKAKHAINQSSINQQDVKSPRILLPDIESQGEFANRVHEIRSIRVQQQMAERYAQMAFESALQRAFAGTL
jgi:type I restriction enzyme S subunit